MNFNKYTNLKYKIAIGNMSAIQKRVDKQKKESLRHDLKIATKIQNAYLTRALYN